MFGGISNDSFLIQQRELVSSLSIYINFLLAKCWGHSGEYWLKVMAVSSVLGYT